MNNALMTLGLCRRAGRLIIGSESTEHSVRCGKSRLVLIASDVSENTSEKYRCLSEEAEKTTFIFLETTMSELAAAVGINGIVGVVSTEDVGFARSVSAKLNSENNNGGHN